MHSLKVISRYPIWIPIVGLCLQAGSSEAGPAQATVPVATHEPSYVYTCQDLTTFAYWATFNVWVDRRRVHHGTDKRILDDARHRVRAIRSMPPSNIAIVEDTAANAFGAQRATINDLNIQGAQENALVTAVAVHDECVRNKGVLTD